MAALHIARENDDVSIFGPGAQRLRAGFEMWKHLPKHGIARDFGAVALDRMGARADHLVVLEVEQDPQDFVILHFGKEMLEYVRGDQTGLRFSKDLQKSPNSELWQQFDSVVQSGKPCVFDTPYHGNFWDFYGLRQLVLPLTTCGERVDRLISVMAFFPK